MVRARLSDILSTILKRRTSAFSICIFIISSMNFTLIAKADGQAFMPVTGPGGGFNQEWCPNLSYLVGVQSRTGSWIDQVTIICADIHADGSLGTKWYGQHHGGNGGSMSEASCKPGYIIDSIGILPTPDKKYAKLLIFNCKAIRGNDRYNLDVGQATVFPDIIQQCKGGGAANGLNTRSGSYVDAVGLNCDNLILTDQAGHPVADNTGTPIPGSNTTPQDPCAGVSGEELAICTTHNLYRAKHGVPPLTWSADLASNARSWVNGCHTTKDKNNNEFFCHQTSTANGGCGNDPNYHFGENLSWGFPTRSGKEAVDEWYCEINQYDFNNPSVGTGVSFGCDNNPNKVTGHFTQVIWKASKKLGCAKNTCPLGGQTNVLWACEYDPPGNFNVNQAGVLQQNVPPPIQGFAGTLIHPAGDTSIKTKTYVISDVDLYDVPGGNGNIIGMLRKGQTMPLIHCKSDDWCQVDSGWAWGSFLLRSGSRALPYSSD